MSYTIEYIPNEGHIYIKGGSPFKIDLSFALADVVTDPISLLSLVKGRHEIGRDTVITILDKFVQIETGSEVSMRIPIKSTTGWEKCEQAVRQFIETV